MSNGYDMAGAGNPEMGGETPEQTEERLRQQEADRNKNAPQTPSYPLPDRGPAPAGGEAPMPLPHQEDPEPAPAGQKDEGRFENREV